MKQIKKIDSVKVVNGKCWLSNFMMSSKDRINIPLNLLDYKFRKFCKVNGLVPVYNR